MKLCFDTNGVFVNFTQTLIQTIKRNHRLSLTEKDFTRSNLSYILGITRTEETQLITYILQQDLPIYPGAKETLEQLSRDGHSIYLLTGRYAPLRELTHIWLKDKSVPYKELYLLEMGKKYQVNVDGLGMIVEDSLEETLEWLSRVKTVLLYGHSYNQTLNIKNLTKRVYNWGEIYQKSTGYPETKRFGNRGHNTAV